MKPMKRFFVGVAALLPAATAIPLHAQTPDDAKAVPALGAVAVRPGDVLEIGVWPDEALGGQFVVEESGFVYLPILGRVQASGLSLERLREELRAGYSTLIKNAVVTITPLVRVSVMGAVVRPGVYMVNPTENVFDVLLEAGWLGPNANAEEIRVVRGSRTLYVNAQRTLEGGVDVTPITLQSGDRIVVPQRSGIPFRTIFTVVHSLLLAANLINRIGN